VRALVTTWALAIAGIAVARLLSPLDPTGLVGANLAGVAAVLFIWLPDGRLRARGEGWEGYGLPAMGRGGRWRELARGVGQGLLCCAVVFPLFAAGFWGFAQVQPVLPGWLGPLVAPYPSAGTLTLRLPERLPLLAAVQLLVVALPEELFYRGWLQTSLARLAPQRGVRLLGARLGSGFVLTQLLFALGHLVSLQPWRLATFFPGLLFGWLRERTGGLVAPIVVHAASNLLITTLERSFFG
jgi:hypothetical protein